MGRNPNFEKRAEIYSMLSEGLTLAEIGTLLGCSKQNVQQMAGSIQHLKDHTRREEIYGLLEQGKYVQDIVGITGLTPNRIYRLVPEARFCEFKKKKQDTHGELLCYRAGCRCDLCKEANTEFAKKHRQLRKNRTPLAHGTYSAYVNWGCRCDPCKAAGAERNRDYSERRRAAQTQLQGQVA